MCHDILGKETYLVPWREGQDGQEAKILFPSEHEIQGNKRQQVLILKVLSIWPGSPVPSPSGISVWVPHSRYTVPLWAGGMLRKHTHPSPGPKSASYHLWQWALPHSWLYLDNLDSTHLIGVTTIFSMHHQGFPRSKCLLTNVKTESGLMRLLNPVIPMLNLASLVLINSGMLSANFPPVQSVPSPTTLGKLLVWLVSLGLQFSHLFFFCLSFLSLSPYLATFSLLYHETLFLSVY